MRHFASPTALIKLVWLLCHAIQVEIVVGRGPDAMPVLPVYDFSMANCSMFRNEAVLRPLFDVWPEDIEGSRFRYCCEYQPNGASSTFELRNYTYNPGGGTLQPAPYYDIGIVENTNLKYFWRYWRLWTLPPNRSSVPLLYCDVTDLRVLYVDRYWKVLRRGAIAWLVVVVPLTMAVFVLLALGYCGVGIYKAVRGEEPKPSLEKEEAFADVCHVFLLAVLGSSLKEGIARSSLRSWRSELMFNGAVVYTYLTLFAAISTFIRHCCFLQLRLAKSKTDAAWVWQKVFLQLVALFTVFMYLVLVEDVTEVSLDAVCSLALGTCVAASVWSAGVELVVMVRFCWQKIIRPRQNVNTPTVLEI